LFEFNVALDAKRSIFLKIIDEDQNINKNSA
jgi:hypothetical protein